MEKLIQINFKHGIGDCTYFAHQLDLYSRRGYRIDLHCNPHREIIFRGNPAVNIVTEDRGFPGHGWSRGPSLESVGTANFFLANKSAVNISKPPLPNIGLLDQTLWEELSSVRYSLSSLVSPEDRLAVARWVKDLPKPLILFHSKGVSLKLAKDIDTPSTLECYRHLLDHTEGSLILLDWHGNAPRVPHGRVRHLRDDFGKATLPQLIALYELSDLLIGIDSGPAHLARFTDLPVLFVWYRHHPVAFALPRDNHVHLVPHHPFHERNRAFRSSYNIVECVGDRIPGAEMGRMAVRMLDGPRYLSPDLLGADIQLQQFVRDWTRAGLCNQGTFVDRDRSFELMVRHLAGCGASFKMVETGTIRKAEDWGGAGYSTYLFGRLASLLGGQLISVDIEPARCVFSQLLVACFGNAVRVVNADSVQFLAEFDQPVDVLYLDSMDLGVPGFREHGLAEAKAGYGNVRPGGLITFDDTHFSQGTFHGKGALGVPWLLEQGCQVLHSGHQTVLQKPA